MNTITRTTDTAPATRQEPALLPPVDVIEDGTGITLYADLPGVPRDKLHLATPESDLATYTFNKHVIKHRFCPTCGCAPFGEGADPSGRATAAINVRCLESVEPADLKIVPVDGRSF